MTVRWISRAQSGLVLADRTRLSVRTDKVVGITKHHTGSRRPSSPQDSFAIWRELQAEAMSGANVNHTRYGDIEYNVGFDDFGQVLIGRDNGWVGAHALSNSNVANRVTFGAAYIGASNPSPLAMQAFHAYVFAASIAIGHPPITFGHLDWVRLGGIATSCPGPYLETSRP